MLRPIGAVASLTGISASTLRAWERRHKVVFPSRNSRGQRLYSAEDLARLLDLAKLVLSGYSISNIATLSTDELRRLRRRDTGINAKTHEIDFKERIVSCFHEKGDAQALRLLHSAAACLSAHDFLDKLIAPLMRNVGREWEARTLHCDKEHDISKVLTKVLRYYCALLECVASRPTVLLTTMPGDPHVLGCWATSYFVRSHGVRSTVLDKSSDAANVAAAVMRSGSSVLGLSISRMHRDDFAGWVRSLLALLPERFPIWIGGQGIVGKRPHLPTNITFIRSLKALGSNLRLL
jgi:DNA-binding transcriptional MerR regulator/methylmalonyl-CoA mutase cobalamin-binding subunit